MVTQCATSFVLFGTGDILAQQAFEKKGSNHDVRAPSPSPLLTRPSGIRPSLILVLHAPSAVRPNRARSVLRWYVHPPLLIAAHSRAR